MSLLPVDLGHQNGQAAMYLRRLNGLWSSQSFASGGSQGYGSGDVCEEF